MSVQQLKKQSEKLREQIVVLKQRAAQAQSDKIEIMRDIATYEDNAWGSEGHINIQEKGAKMLQIVREAQKKLLDAMVDGEKFEL